MRLKNNTIFICDVQTKVLKLLRIDLKLITGKEYHSDLSTSDVIKIIAECNLGWDYLSHEYNSFEDLIIIKHI